jgi:integrase
MGKLTAKQVSNIKAKEKNYRIGDGGGLSLHIRPSGTKTWEFRHISPRNGRPTYAGVGSYPEVSLAKAREKALELKKLVSQGICPKTKKAESKAELASLQNNTFEAVARLWMDSQLNRNVEKTRSNNWRRLELYAFPSLGAIPVASLTAPMAIEALRPIESNGNLETVKRVAQIMNQVMTYAVNAGLIHSNPLSGIKNVFQKPQVTHMPALDPKGLSELVQTMARANMTVTVKLLFEWQLHTMTRSSEASKARWNEIDFDDLIWAIPAPRMKSRRIHKIPLTKQTLAILDAMKSISGHREFIFPSGRDPKKPTHSESVNSALGRNGFSGRTTGHGLRALASTTLNEQGFNPDAIEAALAHLDKNAIRKAYNRTSYLEERRLLMKWWSDHIEKASYGSMSMSVSGVC